jgi:hypothetical protein
MAHAFDVAGKIPLDRIPERKRATAAKGIESHNNRARKAGEERNREVESVVEKAHRHLRDKLGAQKHAALKAAQREERAALAHELEPPGGVGVDRTKARQGYRRRMAAVLKRLSINPRVVTDIVRAANAKFDAALGRPEPHPVRGVHLANNFAKWSALSPLHKVPLNWGVFPPLNPANLDQFDVFGPPFASGFHRANNLVSDNFRVGREYTLVESQGAVGNIVTLDCDDAGSFDFAQSIVDTELFFIYEAKRTGRIEAIIDAMNFFSHHDLSFEDEWGWSEHWTQQYHYLTLNAYHPATPDRLLASVSEFYKEGEDGSFSVRPLTPGADYYGHVLSTGVVQSGDVFFVGVGIRSFDRSRANDVEVHSRSNFQWLIRSVEIRVVP